MIDKWIRNDVESVLSRHDRVVITDAKGAGKFMLGYLKKDVYVKEVGGSDIEELKAKYEAEKELPNDKVAFYTRRRKSELTFLLEYAETNGCIVLDSLENYVKGHLFAYLGLNCNLPSDLLSLAAKVSSGKNLNWWSNVVNNTESILDIDTMLFEFLSSPSEMFGRTDRQVFHEFISSVQQQFSVTVTGNVPESMAQDIMNSLFDGLVNNNISDRFLKIYFRCADSNAFAGCMEGYKAAYALPSVKSVLSTHPEHPFEKLDLQLMQEVSSAMEAGRDMSSYTGYLSKRLVFAGGIRYKSKWLKDLRTLLEFRNRDVNRIRTLDEFSKYYQDSFCRLDTAIRHIYSVALGDKKTLRPLQYKYESSMKELLEKWFSLADSYRPSQQGLLSRLLNGGGRTAVIVCDGLRLEIAEVVSGNVDSRKTRDLAFTELPSITETGMNALFGSKGAMLPAQSRYKKLKEEFDVTIIQMDSLNKGITSDKLVVLFGDIDQTAEKKQQSALKDINNYEALLTERIKELLGMGYDKVWLTSDHGFVITGILDEADKIQSPTVSDGVIAERYCLCHEEKAGLDMICKPGSYGGFEYQYYAKSDKPFLTRGVYGYAHGGFTPEECIIPVYCFEKEESLKLKIDIVNKKELKEVTGNFFTVKLKADNSGTLFGQERRVKIQITVNGKLMSESQIYKIERGSQLNAEFSMPGSGKGKVLVVEADGGSLVDCCEIKRSTSRDLSGLL